MAKKTAKQERIPIPFDEALKLVWKSPPQPKVSSKAAAKKRIPKKTHHGQT